jgi:hypothetical protein
MKEGDVQTDPTGRRPPTERLSERLQAFYDALPGDEKPLMRRILSQAQEDDVSGFLQTRDSVRIRVSEGPHPDSSPSGIVELLL